MKLKCLYFKRRLVMYADRELSHGLTRRIENHLAGCGRCRAALLRLRAGQQFAGQIPRESPRHSQWEAIERLIAAEQPNPLAFKPAWWRGPARVSAAGWVLAVLAISLLVLTVILNQKSRPGSPAAPSVMVGSLDYRDFHTVSISDFGLNTEPHIVAEGYVSDVRIDNEEGDLVFKLVDDVRRPQPFIICEIISPLKITPPPVGSRVRVYGVSRYDGKADHQWYEVHPVLDIQVVRR